MNLMIGLLHLRDQLWRHLSIRTGGDLIETLAARTLRSLLFGVLLWLVLFSSVFLPFAARRTAVFILLMVLLFSVLTSLAALGKGRVKLASWIFLSGLWFIATILTIFSGGIASRGLGLYLAICVTAAWLVGRRAAWISTGVFVGTALVLALLEIAGVHLPQYFPGAPIVVWMLVLLFTAIAILPVSEVLRALGDALKRAQENVEDLKVRELAMQESEERCRLAMEVGRMFAFEWNPINDEVRRSADYTKILGFRGDAERTAGKDTLQRIHPNDREGLIQAVRTLTPNRDSYRTEYRVIHSNGQVLQLQQSGRAFFDSAGQMVRLIGITADISERKRTEAALEESETRFRNLADTVPVSLWVTGPDGMFSFLNKSALRFTGRTMAQLAGSNWSALIHPDDRIASRSAFWSAVADRRGFRVECRFLRADGEYRWILGTGVPNFSPDGVFLGFIGSSVDVTELRQSHQEAVSRQKLESLGVLAGGIAHDFNNLLGAVLAEAELVETNVSGHSSSIEEVQNIKKIAVRGAEIVRELMTYAGESPASVMEPVDLSWLVGDMLELLKVSISKQAVLITRLDPNLPAAWGNAPQIRQIVMNLVINASEAMADKGGTIQVATSRVTRRPGSVLDSGGTLPAGDYVHLEVVDDGCGMTEEATAKIFDPFFTTKFPGRGLGLSVVQGIVRAHGGAVEVASAPGKGAAFQVWLPCTSKTASGVETATGSAATEQSNSRTGTILVVEDEEILRLAVAKSLRRRGFTVIEAHDGSVAMNLLRVHADEIDFILLDFTLPGRSSREVFEEARRIRPGLKIILTSAYGKETVDTTLAGLRVEQFIRKPFHLADLMNLFQGALPL